MSCSRGECDLFHNQLSSISMQKMTQAQATARYKEPVFPALRRSLWIWWFTIVWCLRAWRHFAKQGAQVLRFLLETGVDGCHGWHVLINGWMDNDIDQSLGPQLQSRNPPTTTSQLCADICAPCPLWFPAMTICGVTMRCTVCFL